jgi:hypothetical protein
VLTYRCPTTFREVETSIETTKDKLARMSNLKLSVWCPHCYTSHKIGANEARVESERVN